MSNFRDLEIYKSAYNLAFKVHKLTIQLPEYELYKQVSEIKKFNRKDKR